MAVATAAISSLLVGALAWLAAPALWQRLEQASVATGARVFVALFAVGVLALALFGLSKESGAGNLLAFSLPSATVLALLLSWRARAFREKTVGLESGELAARIEALLPQTQCTQCGFSGCKPYAQAIARGEADIDQCPPGGEAGVRALAELLGRAPKPVNPEHGIDKPAQVALVREAECIGCTKCIQACPVDAIVGASKLMHTVIAELCTGCELCLPPCPVDCIDLVPATAAVRGIPAVSSG